MNKFYVFICLLVLALTANAEYAGPGFYRVHNVGSDRYICIKGTHYERTPRADAFWPCIKMLPAEELTYVSDPGTLIYIPGLDQTSLFAQGVDTYSLTGLYMDVTESSEMHNGMVTYLASTEYNNFRCQFRDEGKGLTAGSGDKPETRWWIEPVNEETIETSYFGVQPADENVKDVNGMYWTTLCCDFPVLIPAEGGVEGAYTVREVQQDEDGNYRALAVKIYGQGEIIPATTPVLIKCAAPTADGNKLLPTGEIANNRNFPLVKDLLMGNYFSNFINHNSLPNAASMGEYIPEQATAATAAYLALGVDDEGKVGFYPQAEGTYMKANTAWLSIDGMDMDGVTVVYLVENVESEPQIQPGDANGDGTLSIGDVILLIDHLLMGSASGDKSIDISLLGADVSGDGEVTIKDVTMIIDMLLEASAQ